MQEKIVLLLLLCGLQRSLGNIKWLAYDKYPHNEIWSKDNACSKKFGLSFRQIRFCKSHFAWMMFAHESASETQEECRDQFKARKWDCDSITSAPKFGSDLKYDTKESAYVHALSAASLALITSRGCLEGKLRDCSCLSTQPHLSFPSEMVDEKNLTNIDNRLGCKDITQVGEKFARSFLTLGFRSRPKNEEQRKQSVVRKHNINIGLREIRNGEEIFCICNGATAGCVVKYCHRRIVQLQNIASRLKEKYDKAIKASNDNLRLVAFSEGNARQSLSTFYKVEPQYKQTLIYIRDGPDHCGKVDGYHITKGRECYLGEDKGTERCDALCCGRGYRETMVQVEAECNCRFIYCCRVECDKCFSMKKILECK